MDTSTVYKSLLVQLSKSPLWSWDAAPSLWAVLNDEDPCVITPVLSVDTVEHFAHVAHAWRAQVGGTLAVGHLCLITEGWETTGERQREVRDAVGISQDGDTVLLRFYRDNGEVVDLDPVTLETESLVAAREVGAAAWA
jgi:hypothetical protein